MRANLTIQLGRTGTRATAVVEADREAGQGTRFSGARLCTAIQRWFRTTRAMAAGRKIAIPREHRPRIGKRPAGFLGNATGT